MSKGRAGCCARDGHLLNEMRWHRLSRPYGHATDEYPLQSHADDATLDRWIGKEPTAGCIGHGERAMAKAKVRTTKSAVVRKSSRKKSPAKKALGTKGRVRAKSRPRSDRAVKVRLSGAVLANIGAVQTLTQFRAAAGATTMQQRTTIVEQAQIMIEQTYVHLPLKRAMHAIDPVQRLKLVKRRIDAYNERAFHNEMISIFVRLRDLHTNYVLPQPFSNNVAFLPFHIEECFEGNPTKSLFVVTEISGTLSDPNFKTGVVVTHWNGIPIATAVDINADREAGSNLDARHLQGLQTMTQRWMGMSLPPDEEWVTIRYLPANGTGPAREARFDWQVFSVQPSGSGGAATGMGGTRDAAAATSALGGSNPYQARIGIDAKGEMLRRARKMLFAPAAMASEKKMADLGDQARTAAQTFHDSLARAAAIAPGLAGTAPAAATASLAPERGSAGRGPAARSASAAPAGAMFDGVDLAANSILPDVIKEFGKATTQNGIFGYIRIVTFSVGNVQVFINEVVRILGLLPQEGLILDVRGNGGGIIAAGEGLLQTLTPKPIEPERFHLINTPLTLLMCENDPDLSVWKNSARESVEIGAAFTQGFPLTPPEFCNSIGQVYQGPVVLITDAGCYSTTDMFSAGFQDHKIGVVLGTSGHTGAGGANVWGHDILEQSLPSSISPFKPIPGGASFRVAIRRSTRVGERSGEPLEDLGVVPDEIYRMTRNDVLNHNVDLIERAGAILAGAPRQRLTVAAQGRPDGSLDITVVTSNVQRIDVLLGGRPVHTRNVTDGTVSFNVAVPSASVEGTALECRGFRGDELVASFRL
jgi:peptidase S41-like protein